MWPMCFRATWHDMWWLRVYRDLLVPLCAKATSLQSSASEVRGILHAVTDVKFVKMGTPSFVVSYRK